MKIEYTDGILAPPDLAGYLEFLSHMDQPHLLTNGAGNGVLLHCTLTTCTLYTG
jgi:hypothetical protein